MRKFPCYLYHICREKDKYNFAVGYIGISTKPSKRWASGGYKQNPHLSNALKKYEDIIKYVIKIGTVKECLKNENMLRPSENLGWNIAKGGGKPPSPKGLPRCVGNLPIEKRRKNYTHSLETRAKISEFQKGFKTFHSERVRGEKNPMYGKKGKDSNTFKGYYVSPAGTFETAKEVSKHYKISLATVRKRCKIGGVIKKSKRQSKDSWGKTWQELGWTFNVITREEEQCQF